MTAFFSESRHWAVTRHEPNLIPKWKQFITNRIQQRIQIPAREIGSPDGTGEQHITNERQPLRGGIEHHMPRRVPRTMAHQPVRSGRLERIAILQPAIRGELAGGRKTKQLGLRRQGIDPELILTLWPNDLHLESIRQIRHRADMIEMRMGDQNRTQRNPGLGDRRLDTRRIATRIDHHGLAALRIPQQRTILLKSGYRYDFKFQRPTSKATMSSETRTADAERRFGGVARVYGAEALTRFRNAHVCVLGLGGVGSWTVEALARSAIGELTLVDMDHIAESNINRQLHATTETLGQAKAEALRERIASINPDCQTHIIDDFITPDNVADILDRGYDWVIDCIDNFRAKAALLAHCRRQRLAVITVGGAGGMTDPLKLAIRDLSRSRQDPLLAKTRKRLRQQYRFPQNPARSFGIAALYSEEGLVYPDGQGGVTAQKPAGAAASGLNCAGGFGSSVAVTASFGFAAAGHVLRKLADDSR